MPSKIIGRIACPECDFANAHVKESEKCVYRYCPECHSQTIAKTDAQKANMTRRMRAVADPTAIASDPVASAPAPGPTGTGSPAAKAPATPALASKHTPAPAPAARRRGLFG